MIQKAVNTWDFKMLHAVWPCPNTEGQGQTLSQTRYSCSPSKKESENGIQIQNIRCNKAALCK